LNGTNGFKINGVTPFDYTGSAVDTAGDVNGDGIDDVVIGAWDSNAGRTGASYVVFGKISGFGASFDLSSLNGTNGFRISGPAANDESGFSVSSAGDVNGDGFSDIAIGAINPYYNAGDSYVVFGSGSGFAANVDLSTLNGTNGFKIDTYAGDQRGWLVSSAGDVNGDGFDDVLVGSKRGGVDGLGSGTSYVLFGKASSFNASIDPSGLDGTNGFQIRGTDPYDYDGRSVSAAGDINGDGFADLIIGASGVSLNGDNSGTSYLILGRMPMSPVTRTGTIASQTLAGGNFNDTLSGGGGNDTLWGHGGNDSIDGGDGIDTAVFSGPRAAYTITVLLGTVTISGPDGTDTLANVERLRFDDETVSPGNVVFSRFDSNGDGKSDLLFQNTDGTVGLWSMNGGSRTSGGNLAQLGAGWSIANIGDFNGDATSDIVLQNTDGSVGMWLLNGGTIMTPTTIAGPGNWPIKGVGDFNGDGKSDILLQNSDSTIGMWLMNGGTIGTGLNVRQSGADWAIAGIGDFNGDGKSDILFENIQDNTIGMWMMNGGTIQTPATVAQAGAGWSVAGIGDFNGDGKSDILLKNTDNFIGLWLMNGGTIQTPTNVAQAGAGWSIKAIGDYNQDGKSDIALQYTDGSVGMWLMNGGTIQTPLNVGASAWAMVTRTS
jgi:hypothetical protein